jgi:three-Cys-motif partner protein
MNEDSKNYLNEPKPTWGGGWTEKKLDAFSKYVMAYLKIMNNCPFWKTIYFDGFVGSGIRGENSEENKIIYNQLFPNISDNIDYKGAAERVLTLNEGFAFDFHYFIDCNELSLAKLKSKLDKYQVNHKFDFQYKCGDCNEEVLKLANAMKSKPKDYAALVFLDPFGMQLNWESIANLQNTRTDIWILVPTGVIVNRLLDKKGELPHLKKLESFFGISEEEIRKQFYETKLQKTLFGEDEVVRKVNEPITKIANLYIQRLKTIWNHVTEKPLVLCNSRNVPIFHFVFASNNKNALKIAKDIIK